MRKQIVIGKGARTNDPNDSSVTVGVFCLYDCWTLSRHYCFFLVHYWELFEQLKRPAYGLVWVPVGLDFSGFFLQFTAWCFTWLVRPYERAAMFYFVFGPALVPATGFEA